MSEQNLVTLGKEAEAELTEKKSVFIGHAAPVRSAEEAESFVLGIRKNHADARHNVFAYTVGSAVRCSDDGEPKGTGGVPVLEVLKKSGVDRAVIVVTRYFGGILLGAGGLLRAYTKSAKDALDAAGISVVRRWVETALDCSYAAAEKLKQEITAFGGIVAGLDYGAAVTIHAYIPEESAEDFKARIFDVSAGGVTVRVTGEDFRAVPRVK